MQAVAWNERIGDFRKLGYEVAAITHDKVAALARFAAANAIAYPLLSDADARIIPAFGIENPQFRKGSPWYGIAHPMIFVVGPDGVVTHRFSARDYRNRIDIDTVLGILRGAEKG